MHVFCNGARKVAAEAHGATQKLLKISSSQRRQLNFDERQVQT